MNKRTITALVGTPIIVAILVAAPKLCSAIIFGIAAAIGAYEVIWRTGLIKFPRLQAYTCAAALSVCIWSYLKMQYIFGILIMTVFTVLLFSEVMISHGKLRLEKLGVCYFAGMIVPFLLSATVRILTFTNGRFLVFIPFILSFFVDIGAYLAGSRFGKHKLSPIISPNKTIEGVIGCVLFGVAGMLVYCLVLQFGFHFQANYLLAVVYGLLGSLASVFGDLMFSAIKRQAGIKDYGMLLPGHGGIMDRLDSMVIVAPLVEVLVVQFPVVIR